MNDQINIEIVIISTFVLTLFAFFLIAVLVVQKNKQNRYASELAISNYRQQNQILRVRLEVQEETMNQLSKEIHDNLNQLLGLTQANVYMLRDKTEKPDDKAVLDNINDLLTHVVTDLQNLSHSLNGSFINNLGLAEALRNEVGYINATKKLLCKLEEEGDGPEIAEDKGLLVFRIAQEAINNVLKHAHATELTIKLKKENHELQLIISDNGIGFDDADTIIGGIGFINMHQRAQVLQARLEIISKRNNGTQISLTLVNV